MDKQQAQDIVRNTFENPFDKGRFIRFVKNLLNYIDESKSFPKPLTGSYIKESFRERIKSYDRIGRFIDANGKIIDILTVCLHREKSIAQARTSQRNFISGYLRGDYGSSSSKDAVIVAFYCEDTTDWRFSLVTIDHVIDVEKLKVKQEFSSAKRFSFLVGENESSHTAQSRLAPILEDDKNKPTLAELEEAFNIEKVTKEFFEKYRDLFLRTKEMLDEVVSKDVKIKTDFETKGVNTVDFAKKLLGQIVFLYFLQKKGWFGVARDADWGTGTKHFLRELFDGRHSAYKNFFNDILEPLFYEALRIDRSHDDGYYSRFNCKIPFLNGGLFDPINNYDWVHTDIILPNELFSNDVKTKEGDTGNGILDIFDRYNFTVKEDEPLEKEVAVDPEMLGKVFENLLEVKDRKSKGTYYTPREIVHYMCQQSLINYLRTILNDVPVSYEKLGDEQTTIFKDNDKKTQLDLTIEHRPCPVISKEEVETLIKYGEGLIENEIAAEKKKEKIKRGLQNSTTIKNELSKVIIHQAKKIDDALENIKVCDPAIGSGAFPVGMMAEIVKTRNVLSAFIKDPDRTIYKFKRECIEKSLYGVDIDPGAVEIAKLRLWLSLVVDEDDIKQIKPLPNLDYKIVCGNSLLGVEKNLFNEALFKELESFKYLLFDETSPTKKQEYKKQIDDLIIKITDGHKEFDFEVYFSEVFHEKKGFDVVIGNPPYVEHKKLKGISSELKKYYSTYSGTADLYVYFYENGINKLCHDGTLIYITSNKFIKTSYGEKLRKYFADFNINEIIDFTDVHVFDALVSSCIFSVSKNKKSNNKVKIAFANDTVLDFPDLTGFIDRNQFFLKQDNLSEKIWQLENATRLALKEKIENCSITMDKTGTINIYRGVTTGFNPAFIIDEEKRNELIKEDKASKAIIKPLLQGRNIKKWNYIKTTDFLIFTRKGIQIKEFPAIKRHLQHFKEALKPGVGRKPGSYNWYEIQDNTAYFPEFEKEKIIWGLTADKWAFAYDNGNHFLPSNGYILTSKVIPIKYLLTLMNSKLMEFYFGFIGIMTAGGAFTLKYETVIEFPIKIVDEAIQSQFITLVDKILSAKQKDPNADTSALEKHIDEMVYALYGLTPEEIAIVERKNK